MRTPPSTTMTTTTPVYGACSACSGCSAWPEWRGANVSTASPRPRRSVRLPPGQRKGQLGLPTTTAEPNPPADDVVRRSAGRRGLCVGQLRPLEKYAAAHVGIEGTVANALAHPYRGGAREWLRYRHRDTVDVIVGAVTGSLTHPERLILGLHHDDGLRIVCGTSALSAAQQAMLSPLLVAASDDHPWRVVINGGHIGCWGGKDIEVVRVQPEGGGRSGRRHAFEAAVGDTSPTSSGRALIYDPSTPSGPDDRRDRRARSTHDIGVVLDGELVADTGRPADFYAVAGAISSRRPDRAVLTYIPFDILSLDGRGRAGWWQ
jgi:hypothetical protein